LNIKTTRNQGFKKLTIIVMLSALGGITSVIIGYTGSLFSSIFPISFVLSQGLSGLHVFWLILSKKLVERKVSGTMTGALKGLVELFLSSHLGIFVFLVSLIEGVVVDLTFIVFRKWENLSIYIAGGFSSASNIFVLQTLLLPELPLYIIILMYMASFASGSLFGGYLVKRVFDVIPANF
jgi:ABC-type thiamin/hydroxymethylpyrimidine transport system permease subunit